MLFIVVHQVYELWFKQILHELDSVDRAVPPGLGGRAQHRRRGLAAGARRPRSRSCWWTSCGVLETMTPLDFLDFRDMLLPASGFQSRQFRADRERRLGRGAARPAVARSHLRLERTSPSTIASAGSSARVPGAAGLPVLGQLRAAVESMLAADRRDDRGAPRRGSRPRSDGAAGRARPHARAASTALLDEPTHERLRAEGARRLSHRATLRRAASSSSTATSRSCTCRSAS